MLTRSMSMPRPGQVGEAGTRGRVGTSGGVVEEAGWKGGGAQAGGAWAWRRRRTPDVGRDEDAVLEVLEGLVELDALRLLDARVDGHRGEVALLQQLVELDGALHALDEDDHLVELERVQQVVKLSVLLRGCQLDVVLAQPMQSQFGIAVDIDLHRLENNHRHIRSGHRGFHDVGAGVTRTSFMNLRHTGRMVGSIVAENIITCLSFGVLMKMFWTCSRMSTTRTSVTSSSGSSRPGKLTELFKHLVALIQHKVLHLRQVNALAADEVKKTPGRGNDHRRLFLLQGGFVSHDRHAAVQDSRFHLGQVLGESSVLMPDLEGQFAHVAQNDNTDVVAGVQLLKRSQHKHCGLPHARLGLTDDIHTQQRVRDALMLHWRAHERFQ